MKEPKIYSAPFPTTRALVDFINERSIQKTDIVTILNVGGQLFLIYYN